MKKLICNDCGDGVGDCGHCKKEIKLNEPILCIEWGEEGHCHFLCAVKSWSDNIATTEMEEEDD